MIKGSGQQGMESHSLFPGEPSVRPNVALQWSIAWGWGGLFLYRRSTSKLWLPRVVQSLQEAWEETADTFIVRESLGSPIGALAVSLGRF